MKRRILAFLSLVALLTSALILPAGATEIPTPDADVPSLCYVDIAVLTASIGIDSKGKASCYAFVETATSSYTVYLSVSLQRYINGGWSTVKNWSTSGSGEATLDKSWYIVSGYYYRTAATATVYTAGGSFVESETVCSLNKYY